MRPFHVDTNASTSTSKRAPLHPFVCHHIQHSLRIHRNSRLLTPPNETPGTHYTHVVLLPISLAEISDHNLNSTPCRALVHPPHRVENHPSLTFPCFNSAVHVCFICWREELISFLLCHARRAVTQVRRLSILFSRTHHFPSPATFQSNAPV